MKIAALALLATLALATPALAQEVSFSPAQKSAIEAIVKDYLTKNPAVMEEALMALDAHMQAKQIASQKQVLRDNKDKLLDPGSVPVVGNPKGDVTIVEFFDYKCGYCRSSHPIMKQLLAADPNVRVIYKEFPILGQVSMQASRFALAAGKQGKYLEAHNALFAPDLNLTLESFDAIAKELGLDADKVKGDMLDQDMFGEIRQNLELAQAIGVRGTPAFVIGEELFPGAMSLEDLKKAVAAVRAKSDDKKQ